MNERYVPEQIIVFSPGSTTFRFGLASDKTPREVPAYIAVRKKNADVPPPPPPPPLALTPLNVPQYGMTPAIPPTSMPRTSTPRTSTPRTSTPRTSTPRTSGPRTSTSGPRTSTPKSPISMKHSPTSSASLDVLMDLDTDNLGDEEKKDQRDLEIKNVIDEEIRRRHMPHARQPNAYLNVERQRAYNSSNSTSSLSLSRDYYLWTNVAHKPTFVYGTDALNISPSEPYEVVRPFSKGSFAVTDKDSHQCIKDRIEGLLKYCIITQMKIPTKEFPDYCIALIVPDTFAKFEIVSMVDIFLGSMRFRSITIHLEAVLACFGSGLSSACVVDIGGQSTKIICVHHGVILPDTRLTMPFGGEDITDLCLYFMESPHSEFYYPLADHPVPKQQQRQLVNAMKETVCKFPEMKRRVVNYTIRVRCPNKPTLMHKLTIGDAICLPPLGLFRPKMFGDCLPKLPLMQFLNKAVSSYDHLGGEFLDVFGNPFTKMKDAKGNFISASHTQEKQKIMTRQSKKTKIVLGLHHAIARSIINMGGAEEQIKMATSLLVIGGSSSFEGFIEELETRLLGLLPSKGITRVEVTPRRDDIPPEILSWTGMAVVCGTDGCKDLWISSVEYDKGYAIRLLRERLPFDIEADLVLVR